MIINRKITKEECHWLDEDIEEGTIVYEFLGCTYGCITNSGIAVTLDINGGYPFFEVPIDSIS